jgi:polo-like kinase 1
MSAQIVDRGGEVEPEEIIEEQIRDAEGRTMMKKYIKGRLLGKGGFAKVFLAHSLPNRTPYAFKIVAKSSIVKDRARRKVRYRHT